MSGVTVPSESATSTQVEHPWRTTVRTAFQMLLTLCVLLPIVLATIGVDPEVVPWAAAAIAVAAAVTRVMALPGVAAFIERYAPWLAPAPKPAPAPVVDGAFQVTDLAARPHDSSTPARHDALE